MWWCGGEVRMMVNRGGSWVRGRGREREEMMEGVYGKNWLLFLMFVVWEYG